MRTYEEYHWILRLWEAGNNKSEIERITQIPRPTIQDCIKRFHSLDELDNAQTKVVALRTGEPLLMTQLKAIRDSSLSSHHSAHAFTLGLYLGDGSISQG